MNIFKKILRSKMFIFINVVIATTLCCFFSIYIYLSTSLKLNGNDIVYVNYTEEYKELGAIFNAFGKDFQGLIDTVGRVKNGKIGNYKITYNLAIPFLNIKKIRIVKVVDNINPVITLNGENSLMVCPNTEYEEDGYTSLDDYDGDLTEKVIKTKVPEGYIYEVSDFFGNKESVLREILYKDEDAPQITLKGSKTLYLRKGNSYNEPGYNVYDNCDENIEVTVTGEVDYNTDGEYILTYTAKDLSGNETSVERKVIVYTDNRIGIVYLTFDDGPSGTGSTEIILDALKRQDVKATFFVTGKGPDWLIKREYDEGHVVALHTNTHDYYTLYKNVDAYFADLEAVRNRVYNITGNYTNIIRFPGGSNNTVSITASGYVIMNTLTQEVLNRGYYYFDWNVSSGDAGGCTTSSCVYSNVVNGLSKSRINVILMHDIKMFTAYAVEDIIVYCKNNGYVFDVLTESVPPVRFK